MTEITRDIITDLLPVYFSGEASEGTRRLVEEYFENDPDFARLAHRMNDRLAEAAPVRLPENHRMRTLRDTQQKVIWLIIALALVLSTIIVLALIAGVVISV
jgi:hypothetical protein